MVLAIVALFWPLIRKALARRSGGLGGPGSADGLAYVGGEE
jgi:hypothetical protein